MHNKLSQARLTTAPHSPPNQTFTLSLKKPNVQWQRTDKEDMARILLSRKKEWNCAIYRIMDGLRACHMRKKSERKISIVYLFVEAKKMVRIQLFAKKLLYNFPVWKNTSFKFLKCQLF